MGTSFLGKTFLIGPRYRCCPGNVGTTLCCRQTDGKIARMTVNETEAYDGEKDLACHASNGKTPRNEVMYGPAGVIYLYLCYGMHWLLNVVCREEGYPAAVLLRGTLEVTGPGRLTKKLGITGELNRKRATPKSGIWFGKRERK